MSEGLRGRGLLNPAGEATGAGRQLRGIIEQKTDQLAEQPYRALSSREMDEAMRLLASLATTITRSGDIPFPNPIGLPAPELP